MHTRLFMHTRRQLLAGLVAGPALAAGARAGLRDPRPALSLAVVPQFSAAEIHQRWAPLVERLAQAVDRAIELRILPSIPAFENEVLAGTPDLAYLNPYQQVMADRAQHYLPLVRHAELLTGVLVVRRDGPIRAVADLAGQSVAFPSPNAFGASLYMRALIANRERVSIQPMYVQTHGNVYRQVLQGRVAAGGGVNQTLSQERPEVREGLRVLMETPGAASHPLSAHPRVPAALGAALTEALLALADEPEGAALLKGVQMARPVRADQRRDYAPLALLGLEKFVVLEPAAGGR